MVATAGDGGDGGPRGQADRNRGAAVGRGAVAQLALAVVAPGQDLAAGGQRQAVETAAGDGGDGGPRGQADLDRGGDAKATGGGGGAVAQLAVVVVAPGQDLAGGGQRQAVLSAAGDGGDGGPRRQADRNRGAAVGGGAVAQLAGAVVAPGQDLAGGGQRQAVVTTSGDGGDGGPRGQADRNRGAAVGGGAVAQLAVAVVAPGQDLAGGGQRQAVGAAGCDGGDGGPRGQADRNRGAAVGGGAVAQLAVGRCSPRPAPGRWRSAPGCGTSRRRWR